jgi:regulator of replication initiation timing
MTVSDTAANPSELDLLRQRNTELEAKLKAEREEKRISASSFIEEIDKLKKKNADLFTENFDLKREVANLRKELGNRIEELEKSREDVESRFAKVEQGSSVIDAGFHPEQSQDVPQDIPSKNR